MKGIENSDDEDFEDTSNQPKTSQNKKDTKMKIPQIDSSIS